MDKNESKPYKMVAKDFYALLEKQDRKCVLTGRDLSVENIQGEHIVPLKKGGKHEASNICLVHNMTGHLKRYYTEAEIVELAKDIIQTVGSKYGIKVKSGKRK